MVFVLPFPIWFIILLGTSYAWIWQPWKAFCLCHKKRSAFDFGHPGFSSKRAIHLDTMFNLFRVSKGTVIRDVGFWHVSSLLESCSAAHHLGDQGDAASASLTLKFPYLPSGAFYSGNKLVKACWEDSASYVKRGGGGGSVTKSCPTLVTPWTSMGFPRQEYWSGLPFPSLGDRPEPGIEPASPVLTGRIFTIEPLGRAILSFPLDKWRKGQNKHWATYFLGKEKLLSSKLKKAEEREKETDRKRSCCCCCCC